MPNTNLVTVEAIADFYEVDIRTVQNWETRFTEKNLPKSRAERGLYNFLIFTKNVYKLLKEENHILKTSGDEKLHALKMKTQRIIIMEREAKYKKQIKSLIDFDAVRMAWIDETTKLRKEIIALRNKLPIALEGIIEHAKRDEIIDREVFSCLNALGELKINLDEDEEEEPELEPETELEQLEN